MDSYKRPRAFVSVIIPTYNSADYLPTAIESVLNQRGAGRMFAMEIIVVDDGSTDNTKDILKKYQDKIIYCNILNSGRPAVPRNIGAKMAKGEYLAFLDSDDVWLPNKIYSQLKQFKQDPSVVLISSNAEKITASGKRTKELVVLKNLLPKEISFGGLLKNNFICTSATMVRKEPFERAGGFDERASFKAVEDYELWLRMTARDKIFYQTLPYVLYRVHANNISKSSAHLANKRLIIVYQSVFRYVASYDQRVATLKQLAIVYSALASSGRLLDKIVYKLFSKLTSLRARFLYN